MIVKFLRTHWALSTCLWLTMTGAVVGSIYALYHNGPLFLGASIGAAIMAGISAFEQFFVRRSQGEWLRRLPLPGFIAISSLVWLAIIGLCLLVGDWQDDSGLMATSFTADTAFSAFSALFVNTVMRLSSLIGGRVFFSFLSGSYRHPVQEERIFLFLDLVGSTSIAERLGPVQYHAFLRDFIETIEPPVRNYGGEIYQYVGDEVVATWPVGSKMANRRAIECHFAMLEAIERFSSRFENRYGATPKFCCGIHCGEVVAGEIGDYRRQIVFVGDVVNTAARIEAYAKLQGCQLVVSETLLSRIRLPGETVATPLGKIQLKGKVETVELLIVSK